MEERLQKYMAACGVGSRRSCEAMIKAGRVRVNGTVIRTLGTKINSSKDCVEVDGKTIKKDERLRYFMLHKPAGYLTTMRDPGKRPTIYDLLPELKGRYVPVGRLDMDTEGLLLLTNDGDFCYRLTHPKYEIKKTYVAKVRGLVSLEVIKALEEGVELEDGKTAPAKARIIKKLRNTTTVEHVIHEGKKRQVRRMFEAQGHPVLQLRRIAIDKLSLKGVDQGEIRELTEKERKQLLARLNLPVL